MDGLLLALFSRDPVLAAARDKVQDWIRTFTLPSTALLYP